MLCVFDGGHALLKGVPSRICGPRILKSLSTSGQGFPRLKREIRNLVYSWRGLRKGGGDRDWEDDSSSVGIMGLPSMNGARGPTVKVLGMRHQRRSDAKNFSDMSTVCYHAPGFG